MGIVGRFRDRATAGYALAPLIDEVASGPRVVLGLPRGGLVIAGAVAEKLAAPLGVAWVRRLIAPKEPDVLLGAVDIDGDVTLNADAAGAEGLGPSFVAALARRAHNRLREAWAAAPGPDPATLVPGKTAIVVDDGMTTGLTMIAAIRWVRRQLAARVVIAVPVVDARIWAKVAEEADDAVTLDQRDDGPIARSEIYERFRRVTKKDVDALLAARADLSRMPVAEPPA